MCSFTVYLELGQYVNVEPVGLAPLCVAAVHVVSAGEDDLKHLFEVRAVDQESAHVLDVVHPVLDVCHGVSELCLKYWVNEMNY